MILKTEPFKRCSFYQLLGILYNLFKHTQLDQWNLLMDRFGLCSLFSIQITILLVASKCDSFEQAWNLGNIPTLKTMSVMLEFS